MKISDLPVVYKKISCDILVTRTFSDENVLKNLIAKGDFDIHEAA